MQKSILAIILRFLFSGSSQRYGRGYGRSYGRRGRFSIIGIILLLIGVEFASLWTNGDAKLPTSLEPEAYQQQTERVQDSERTQTYADSQQLRHHYTFRNDRLLNQHYEKHGREMGFPNAQAYQKAALNVVNNPASFHKVEMDDGDDVYYLEITNEFVIVSTDGYIRTYFKPSNGIKYYYSK